MVSTKEIAKAERERKFFSLFAKSLGWELSADSVESRPKPEPDILYRGRHGSIAFELAEICASDVAQQTARLVKSDSVSAIWTSDPTEDILRKKLLKKYETDLQIELLLYHDGRVVTPDSDVVPVIQDELIANENHIFRRIWFFGEKSRFEFFATGDILNSISL